MLFKNWKHMLTLIESYNSSILEEKEYTEIKRIQNKFFNDFNNNDIQELDKKLGYLLTWLFGLSIKKDYDKVLSQLENENLTVFNLYQILYCNSFIMKK